MRYELRFQGLSCAKGLQEEAVLLPSARSHRFSRFSSRYKISKRLRLEKETLALKLSPPVSCLQWLRKHKVDSEFTVGGKSEAVRWSPSNVWRGIPLMRQEDSILLLCTEADAANTSIQRPKLKRQKPLRAPERQRQLLVFAFDLRCLSCRRDLPASLPGDLQGNLVRAAE